MANPQFTSNATLRLGAGIGTLRATTSLTLNRTSNAKMIPTTTGERGFTSGVSTAEISGNIHTIRESSQQRALMALYESQTPVSYDYFDGLMHHVGDGVISSLNVASQTNEAIEYSLSMACADGTST